MCTRDKIIFKATETIHNELLFCSFVFQAYVDCHTSVASVFLKENTNLVSSSGKYDWLRLCFVLGADLVLGMVGLSQAIVSQWS